MRSNASAVHAAVAAIHHEFANWGWIIREQTMDYGTDAQVEVVTDDRPTGRLISLVIKAGSSYFARPVKGGWHYHGDEAHLLYWMRYELPVVLVFYDPESRLAYWASMTPNAVQYTSSGWQILVPSDQVLDERSRKPLEELAGVLRRGGPAEEARWGVADRVVARAEAAAAEPVPPPTAGTFCQWLGTLVDRFRHSVEERDLWRALWDDSLTNPREEKIVQTIAAAVWDGICERDNVDVTREANTGRGLVDFKFAASRQERGLIEVKLLASTRLRQGVEHQLPQYMTSERVTCAYYMCVGFTDADLHAQRIQVVLDGCAAAKARTRLTIKPRFIDARPKAAASKLSPPN